MSFYCTVSNICPLCPPLSAFWVCVMVTGWQNWLAGFLCCVGKTSVAIFFDTIIVINLWHDNKCLERCYYSLNFTHLYHIQWPWWYFKVTAVSNSSNWKFYVLIWLSWNFVWSLSTSTRPWTYHYFLFLLIFNGDNWHVFWFDKKFNVGFSSDTL